MSGVKVLRVGDAVADSPVGAGEITGCTDRGYPRVNGVACSWMLLADGCWYDPHGVADRDITARTPETGASQ